MKKMMHWMLSAAIRPLVLTMVFCGTSVFNIDFGDDEATGIISIENGKLKIENDADTWYSLDGRKLSGKPSVKNYMGN